jgi:hypothetical protein
MNQQGWQNLHVEDWSAENGTSGEQLIKRSDQVNRALWIGRCPASVDGDDWLQQQRKTVENHSTPTIFLYSTVLGSVTIKLQQFSIIYVFSSMQVSEEDDGENDDEDAADQPGPSKRRRLA